MDTYLAVDFRKTLLVAHLSLVWPAIALSLVTASEYVTLTKVVYLISGFSPIPAPTQLVLVNVPYDHPVLTEHPAYEESRQESRRPCYSH